MIDSVLDKIIARLRLYLHRNIYASTEEVQALFGTDKINQLVFNAKNKRPINVGFLCMNISMFKYETIVKSMLKDKDFNPIVIIAPRNELWSSNKQEIKEMKSYFEKIGFPYINLKYPALNIGQDLSTYKLDIVFYPQPYESNCPQEYYFNKLTDKLLCYVPYAYIQTIDDFIYASLLHKIAWKHYLPNNINLREAETLLPTVENQVATGYPGYDIYNECKPLEWKCKNKKKVIWAPHHSIQKDGWLHLSSFLDIYEDMVKIAQQYSGTVQFAFKPHPHLYPALCNHWGKERTDAYYNLWRTMDNTMICEGEAYPLFKSSDALIHDCGSFIMEYHYTQNPCLYITLNGPIQLNFDEQGKAAYEAHYHATKKGDIESFITNVVLDGNDSMKPQRRQVLEEYIKPKNGKTATENIINDIKTSLGIM